MVPAGTSFGCDDGDRTPQGQVFQATKFGIRIESIDAQDMSGYDQLSWCLILAYSVTSYDQLILASYPVFGFRHFSMCPTLVQALKMYEVREQVLDSDQWDLRHNHHHHHHHHHHHPKRDVAGSFCDTGSNPSIQHVLWPFTGASSESTIWRQSHHRTDQGAA